MSTLTYALDALVGNSFSAAIAVAIMSVLVLLLFWILSAGDKESGIVKWVGIGAVGLYAVMGFVQKKKAASSLLDVSPFVTSTL